MTPYRGRKRRTLDPKTGRLSRSLGAVARLTPPPRPLRRRGVRFENLALVPASLLGSMGQVQEIQGRLPRGQILIIVPADESSRRTAAERVAAKLRARGRAVTTVAAGVLAEGSDGRDTVASLRRDL